MPSRATSFPDSVDVPRHAGRARNICRYSPLADRVAALVAHPARVAHFSGVRATSDSISVSHLVVWVAWTSCAVNQPDHAPALRAASGDCGHRVGALVHLVGYLSRSPVSPAMPLKLSEYGTCEAAISSIGRSVRILFSISSRISENSRFVRKFCQKI